MTALVMSRPLLLTPLLYAALIKVAAFILRRIKVSWKHALLFALLAMVVGAMGAFANLATDRVVAAPLVGLISIAVQLTLGSWYFKDRARLVTGAPVGLARGALLALIAIAFVVVLATIVIVAFPPRT